MNCVPTNVLIDVSALAARAFFRAGGLSLTRLGPALQSFEDLALPLLEQACVAAFEGRSNFRKQIYPQYKSGRKAKPELLIELLLTLPGWFLERGVPCVRPVSGEADDAVATLVERYLPAVLRGELRVALASFDGDLLALSHHAGGSGAGVHPLTFERGAWRCLSGEEVENRYGVPPCRIELFKAISGDSSDGYGGIPGLGPVAAKRLCGQFASIPALYRGLEGLPRAERARCESFGLESALLMAKLAGLERRAELVGHL